MKRDLQQLVDHFDKLAIPRQGRYVNEPAVVDERGIEYVPPKKTSFSFWTAFLTAIILIVLFLIYHYF